MRTEMIARVETEIRLTIEDRPSGGLRIYADGLPELILAGSSAAMVMESVVPAMKAVLARKGIKVSRLVIDPAPEQGRTKC